MIIEKNLTEKKNLTDRLLKALKPAPVGKTYDVRDTVVPGFRVRVSETGRCTFILLTRFPGSSNPTRRAIGEYGAMTLAQARETAQDWHRLIARGVDPQFEQERQRQAALRQQENSFAFICEEYIKRHVRKTRKAAEVESDLRREFIPILGARPITDITQHDVVAIIDEVVDRGTPYQAHNLLGHIRTMYNWAIARGIYGIERSPCDRLKPAAVIGKKLARQRILNEVEIRAFWTSTETLGYPYGPLLRLLLITGQRLREVGEARWTEFDLQKKLWTISATRMKADAAHVVPLSPEAIKILEALPRFHHGDHLFSTTFGAKAVDGFAKAKDKVDGEMLKHLPAPPAPWVFHDLRRTMRTGLSALPVPDLVRELVIAHTKPGLHKVYDQFAYLGEKRQALDLWAGRLRDIVEPPAANVVKFARVEG
jgi:integrase